MKERRKERGRAGVRGKRKQDMEASRGKVPGGPPGHCPQREELMDPRG